MQKFYTNKAELNRVQQPDEIITSDAIDLQPTANTSIVTPSNDVSVVSVDGLKHVDGRIAAKYVKSWKSMFVFISKKWMMFGPIHQIIRGTSTLRKYIFVEEISSPKPWKLIPQNSTSFTFS